MAREIKNLIESEKIIWTRHAREKIRQYNLSESRLKRVLRKPDRKELGIAPRTIAIMQITGTKKHPTEIWMMYQITKSKIKNQKSKITKIISAWRYPGKSPIGEPPPIPEDILWDLGIKN
jgi:hypothetical protein